MVRFNNNELEIALVTYNRPSCVKEWINICLEQIKNRNIKFSIYDSSTNDKTKKIVELQNDMNNNYINYVRIDSNVTIGYKPVIPMMTSQCKYIWVCADRRYHDFEELDLYIFPKILEGKYAFIHLGTDLINDSYEKEYRDDKAMWFYDNIVGMTWFGMQILRTDMFQNLKNSPKVWNYYEQKFKEICGFTHLGYFLIAFAMKNYEAYIHRIKYYSVSVSTTRSWNDKFYTYLIGDFVKLLDSIPQVYTSKYEAVKKFLKTINCFSDSSLYLGRTHGDLSEIYEPYKEKGYWELFTDETDKIAFYAKAPLSKVKKHYFLELSGECTLEDLMLETHKIIDVLRDNCDKKIFIYGAGGGGKYVQNIFNENDILINGFIDKNWEKIKSLNGLDVIWLDSISAKDSIIIVSIMTYHKQIEDECNKYGFCDEENMYYLIKRLIGGTYGCIETIQNRM